MKKIFLLLSISAFIFQACDKIDDPIPKDASSSASDGNIEFVVDASLGLSSIDSIRDFISSKSWDSIESVDNSAQRFVVLEEFTGHYCNNCPDGAREIARLKGEYGDQIIPIAIHATQQFAAPRTAAGKYSTDFRVEGGHGETYLGDLNIGALPQGIVSRTTSSGRQISQWESDFLAIRNNAPLASLTIKNFYASTDTIVRTRIEINWLNTSSENYNLQVHLLESNVIDWQLDGPTDVPDYNHKHILRKVVNGTYGKALKDATIGSKETIEYITTFKNAWKPENIEVVAFVFNSDPNSYEIIQGNAAHIK